MKTAAFILGVPFACLILYGLYQYKAHDKAWGIKLCLWLCALLCLAGVGFGTESIVPPILIAASVLGARLAWRVCGRKCSGWKLHAMRGLTVGVIFWPLLAIRFHVLKHFWQYHHILVAVEGVEIIWFFLYGIPGIILAGTLALCLSLVMTRGKGLGRKSVAIVTVALGIALLPCLNWYAAGTVDLRVAAYEGYFHTLRYAVRSRPGLMNARDSHRGTPLLWASYKADLSAVRFLLSAGSDVNARDTYGTTPMIRLLEGATFGRDRLTVAELLIEAGADLNVKSHFDGCTALHTAICQGRLEIANLLIRRGADVNIADHKGNVPLNYLIPDGLNYEFLAPDLETLKLLIKSGANVRVRGHLGEEPLSALLFHSHGSDAVEEGARLLMEAGADVDLVEGDDFNPRSPISHAFEEGKWSMAEMMLMKRRQPNAKLVDGRSPLHYAAHSKKTKIVRYLIAKGADPNVRDDRNETPLIDALRGRSYECAKLLLNAGADAKVKDQKRNNTLHLAAPSAPLDLIQTLLDKGVDVNDRNDSSRTPMFYAWKARADKTVELLKKHGGKVQEGWMRR